MKKQWVICAQSGNGMWSFYCDSDTQGEIMVPNAESYAVVFGNRLSAIRKAEVLADSWKGLSHWQAISATY